MNHDSAIGTLARDLETMITAMAPGDRLPSSRELMRKRGVSPITVSRAIALLVASGRVVVRPGAGTYVAEEKPQLRAVDLSWQSGALGERPIDADGLAPLFEGPNHDDAISLTLGYLHPSLMPESLLASAWSRAGRLPDAFHRPPTEGLSGLRAWFARTIAPGIEPRDVLIASGGQGAISTAIRAVAAPGEPLLMESPTYPGAVAVALAAGLKPVPVPTDPDGVIIGQLEMAFARTGARAVYLQPTFQNPTGSVLGAERRAQVLAAAAQAGAFVIEDDFARWLGHGVKVPAPLIADDREGRVIYITSLTKAAAPSLRVSAVISRGAVSERIRALRLVDDLFVPRPVQEAALELVSRPGWGRHVSALSEALSARASAMIAAINRHTPQLQVVSRPRGGMHVWASMPIAVDEREVQRRARAGGVIVNPGRAFFPGEPPGPFLRLTYTAVPDLATLDEGMRRLAAAAPELT